jgi:hypothetical protein
MMRDAKRERSTEKGCGMTEDVQLAALAVIELTARQIVDPGAHPVAPGRARGDPA